MNTTLLAYGFIILIATGLGTLARSLRQPLILGYILTGILLGAVHFEFGIFSESLELFSQLGVAFLLFLIGVELNVRELKEIRSLSVAVGFLQVIFTTLAAFLLMRLLSLPPVTALYFSFAVTFSSTIIIVKLLNELKVTQSLYGRISVGILLVQDFFAVLGLILVSSLSGEAATPFLILISITVLKVILLLLIAILLGYYLVPLFFELISPSSELILLSSIAWALLASLFTQWIGFSFEAGAFLAGLTLAASPVNLEILSKVKPLRDFFIILFFIYLGQQMEFRLSSPPLLVLTLTLFVVFFKPLLVYVLMRLLRHQMRTSFFTAINQSQVSEFSLILAVLGWQTGHLTQEALSIITLVAVLSIGASSYLITRAERIYKLFAQKDRSLKEAFLSESQLARLGGHVILFGCHRMGAEFLRILKKTGSQVVVVDFDPAIIRRLKEREKDEEALVLQADLADVEILESLQAEKARVIISTVPDWEDNLTLIAAARHLRSRPLVVVTAKQTLEAISYYQSGADYVVLPETLAGKAIAHLIESHWDDFDSLRQAGQQHYLFLTNGHETKKPYLKR